MANPTVLNMAYRCVKEHMTTRPQPTPLPWRSALHIVDLIDMELARLHRREQVWGWSLIAAIVVSIGNAIALVTVPITSRWYAILGVSTVAVLVYLVLYWIWKLRILTRRIALRDARDRAAASRYRGRGGRP